MVRVSGIAQCASYDHALYSVQSLSRIYGTHVYLYFFRKDNVQSYLPLLLTNTVFVIFCSMDSNVLRFLMQEASKLGLHTRRSHDSEAHV
jgi:hypothetical protein